MPRTPATSLCSALTQISRGKPEALADTSLRSRHDGNFPPHVVGALSPRERSPVHAQDSSRCRHRSGFGCTPLLAGWAIRKLLHTPASLP